MNLINTTKTALGMNNRQFGIWLGDQLNRKPFIHQRIYEYSHGKKQYPPAVKKACMPVAVHYVAAIIESKHETDDIESVLLDTL